MPDKTFSYDYFALKGQDITAWHDAFFWPMTWETTTQTNLDVEAIFYEQINRLGNTFEGDCLVIASSLATNIIRILNHSMAVDRLMREGYSIRTSDRLNLVPKLIRGESLSFAFMDLWGLGRESRSIRKTKDLVLSWKYNREKPLLAVADHFRRERRVFAFPNENVTGRLHVRSQSKWVRLTSPEEWLDPSLASPPSAASVRILNDLTHRLVNIAVDYACKSHGLTLNPQIIDNLANQIRQGLYHVAQVYSAILRVAARLNPERILSPTGSKPLARAVNLAVRRNGGKATGHPHSYFICHSSSPKQILRELPTVDEFMAYTPGSVPLFHRNMAINPTARDNPVAINHDNFDGLYRLWTKWKNKPLPEHIRTVMVLELNFIPEWSGYHVTDPMVTFHFYYTLCKFLSNNGYKIIFKRRPKCSDWEGLNIFESIPNVEVEHRHFEAPGIIDRADAVFVQYGMSSTLFYSMCTNKTVIYVDAGWEPWFPDVKELMAKRCNILHCWYDERNRQCFDESELKEILEQKPEQPDTKFLEKYLFPEGV